MNTWRQIGIRRFKSHAQHKSKPGWLGISRLDADQLTDLAWGGHIHMATRVSRTKERYTLYVTETLLVRNKDGGEDYVSDLGKPI